MRSAGSSFLFACLFPLFMIFVTGGILAVYREDRKIHGGRLFRGIGRVLLAVCAAGTVLRWFRSAFCSEYSLA